MLLYKSKEVTGYKRPYSCKIDAVLECPYIIKTVLFV